MSTEDTPREDTMTAANPDTDYRQALDALQAAQRTLGATPRSDVEARETAKRQLDEASARAREAREAKKQHDMLRNFAGLTSPLADVVAARFAAEVVAELHKAAIAIVEERQRKSAAKRAAKAATPPEPQPPPAAPPPPAQRGPEVFYCARRDAR